MRIVVNSSCAVAGGAITHLRHVLPAMLEHLGDDELVVVGTAETRERLEPPVGLDWVEVPPRSGGLAGRLAFENSTLPALVRSLGADVLFHPGNFSAFRVRVPQVIVVHNLAPFIEEVIAGESTAQKARLRALAWLTRASLRSASRTIFLSQWGRELVLGDVHDPGDRMPVIPFGGEYPVGDDPNALARSGVSEDAFVLTVSHLYRYKKLEKLLDAWAALGDRVAHWPLLVAGAPYDAEYARRMEERARSAKGPVRFIGAVDAPTLAALMRTCRAFVFTSEAENLPITLLEARSAGCAILTNRTCSMPETCGDAAAYADPPHADQYRAELERLLFDGAHRQEMRKRARERVKRYGWSETAARTLAVLRAAASEGRS